MKQLKVLFSLVLLMIIIPVETKAMVFIKMDEEGNYINDAEFRIRNIDGSIEYEVLKSTDENNASYGTYEFNQSGIDDYSKVISVLGEEEIQILNDLKDYNKIEYYIDLSTQEYDSEYSKALATRGIIVSFNEELVWHPGTCWFENDNMFCQDGGLLPEVDYNTVVIRIPVIMILEETKAPVGLKKEKSIIVFDYGLKYYFDDNHQFIKLGANYPSFASDGENEEYNDKVSYRVNKITKYFYDVDYSNIIGLSMKLSSLSDLSDYYYSNSCDLGVIDERDCENVQIMVDYKDLSRLTIDSYVNNSGSVNVDKGSTIEYKIVIQNKGTGDSTNNVITSSIPQGFEYVNNSANCNGQYIVSLNAVVWNIDLIKTEDIKELSYGLKVKEHINISQANISGATLVNDSNNVVESNETHVVFQGLVNPKTGVTNIILLLILGCIVGLVMYLIVDDKKINNI